MARRQTTAQNLADLVRNLGGEPDGTIAGLVQQLEDLARDGAIAPEMVDERIESFVEDPANWAQLSEEDLDDIFNVM